jgi:hypothetical protein
MFIPVNFVETGGARHGRRKFTGPVNSPGIVQPR